MKRRTAKDALGKTYQSLSEGIKKHKTAFLLLSILAAPSLVALFSHSFGKENPFFFISGLSLLILGIILIVHFAPKNYRRAIALAFIFSIGLKFFIASQFYGNWDMESYQIVSGILDRDPSANFYTETERYNYSPFWAWVLYGLDSISDATQVPFPFLVKSLLIAVDVFVGMLILTIAQSEGRNPKEQFLAVAKFLFNPLSIMVTSFGSQFDMMAISLLLLFYYLHEVRKKRSLLIDLLYGFSIAAKQVTIFPLFFLALMRKGWGKLLFLIVASLPFLILILPYLFTGWRHIMKSVFGYGGVWGYWGYSRWLEYFTTLFGWKGLQLFFQTYLSFAMIALTFLAMIAYFTRYNKTEMRDGIIMSWLIFVVLMAGFGTQYLVWIVPFAALWGRHFYWFYTSLASIVMLLFYIGDGTQNLFLREVIAYSAIAPFLYLLCIYWLYWMHKEIKEKHRLQAKNAPSP